MEKVNDIYQFNLKLLQGIGIEFKEWQHEPILDFATDERVAAQLGWTGTHSKSLFLKLKGSGYALFLTDKDSRLASKTIKQLLGKKPEICGNNEMTEVIGCLPGAVCPFGLPEEIPLIVDKRLYQHRELLYTPGDPEATIGISGTALQQVLTRLTNPIFEI